jgi:hypothetical protein
MNLGPTLLLSPLLISLALPLAACSGGSGGIGPSPVPPDATPALREGAPPAGGNVCETTCAHLTACGTPYDANCASSCASAAASYRSCADAANAANDCNALATCVFEASAQVLCPSGGGVPTGAGTCSAAALCQGQCNASGAAPSSCGCECIRTMSPSVAMDLLIKDSCAVIRCPTECNPAAPTPACNTCFNQMCADVSQACAAR